ncbi:MAG TPA: TetR/AcrR family transcriptional regulator [Tepidiformaceae bacterium]|nr:TetR/AcrR family transcriptional regulator [Tepidiformaceae bacterium]
MRRTREQLAQENRAAVLDAARRNFERNGFHGAALDAIADEAGFSKGVVYSQFGSKDELMLAVLEQNIERRHIAMRTRFERGEAPAHPTELARIAIRESVATVAWQAALLEFRCHAWRHPDLNRRYQELHARTIANLAGLLELMFTSHGEVPPVPPIELARLGLAAGNGAVAEFMADPSLDLETVARAFGSGMVAALSQRTGDP